MVFNLAFLANAHQRQIKDRIKICLHEDGVVLTAPDAKINTGKILFEKKANLSTRQINQLYSIRCQLVFISNLPVVICQELNPWRSGDRLRDE